MKCFSKIVLAELEKKNIGVPEFARKMGFSPQYTYNLLNGRRSKRWNSDSIEKACGILGIEIQFVTKSA